MPSSWNAVEWNADEKPANEACHMARSTEMTRYVAFKGVHPQYSKPAEHTEPYAR